MKKAFKAIVSLVLALALVFGATSVAFASEDESCDCTNAPVVYVGGIGAPIFSTDENGEEYTVFPIENDKIVNSIISFLPVAALAGIFGGWSTFADALDLMLNELFADCMCDNTGTPMKDTYVDDCEEVTLQEHIQDNNEFRFEYDWRLDPYETAEKLDSYIDEVIAVTGHDRVILNGFSEGGEITFAYLDAYGSDKIEKYFAVSSAFQGLDIIGKLFTKQCSISADGVANFLDTFLPANGVSKSITDMLGVFKDLGIYKLVESLGNTILDNCFDKIFTSFARNTFACMPGVFNFTPADYYDDAVKMVFGENLHYAKLIEKYDRYHNAQLNAEKILRQAQANGTAVCLVSYYGQYLLPVAGNSSLHSDALIDSARTSGGATFAPIGETLGERYVQKVDDGHNHLSPDGSVDASTCILPESTWFIRGFTHWTETCALTDWIIECDGQPTVFDNPAFPQFLVGDQVTGAVIVQE